jgi:Protein of unknown function (DUF3054)
VDQRRQVIALSVAADVAAVLLFALLGSRSHDGGGAGEVLAIAAPFVVGALLGWLLSPVARDAPMSVRAGWHVWAATLAIGLLARRFVFSRGTAPAFVIVAAMVLAVLIIGWRWIRASRIDRRALRSPRPPSRAER